MEQLYINTTNSDNKTSIYINNLKGNKISSRKQAKRKFWEELIAYFPLMRRGPHRK
jgi:hypothetical protein